MKNTIKQLKVASPLMLSITTAFLLSSGVANASEWKTVSGSACQSYAEGHLTGVELTRNESGIRFSSQGTGHIAHQVYCPIEIEKSESARYVKVSINYDKDASSTMGCRLQTTNFDGWRRSTGSYLARGKHTKNLAINSLPSGATGILCNMNNRDRIYSIDYKMQ